LEKTFGFDFSGGRKEGVKEGRQEEENKVIAKLLGFWTTTTAYKERVRRERERERDRSCRTGGRLALRLIPSGLLLIPIALFMKLFLLLFWLFCGDILFCVVFFPRLSSLLRLLSHSFLSLSSLQLKEASRVRSCFYIFKCPGFFKQIV
jgi:hypothetical protein